MRLADPLRELDDDCLRAADVAKPIAVLVAHQLADELNAAGSQAGTASMSSAVARSEKSPGNPGLFA
jgi:hypothetical protein